MATKPIAWAEPIGNIRAGTCGWTEKGLIDSGGFYPSKKMSAEERLKFYAENFPVVEVDSTFYAIPSEQNAKLWVERTPKQFKFNIKALGLFTHHASVTKALPSNVRDKLPKDTKSRVYMRSLSSPVQKLIWDMFESALTPLAKAGKLGAVLFQFGPWFIKNRDNVAYLESLKDRLPWPIAVEFRGGEWMTERSGPRTLELLEKWGLTYVCVDEPQGFKSSTPPVVARTAPLAYMRLHGRNADTWEQKGLPDAPSRFNYEYSAKEIEEFAEKAEGLSKGAEEVHVMFNNNFRDYHTRAAASFNKMMKKLHDRGEIKPGHEG